MMRCKHVVEQRVKWSSVEWPMVQTHRGEQGNMKAQGMGGGGRGEGQRATKDTRLDENPLERAGQQAEDMRLITQMRATRK